MLFFSSNNKQRNVQKQLVRIINGLCSPLSMFQDGPRIEGRVNITMAVQFVPWNLRRPSVELAVAVTTRELSSSGLSIVVHEPIKCAKCAVGWRHDGELVFARGECVHQDPIGAGFWNVGVQFQEILSADDYPELFELTI